MFNDLYITIPEDFEEKYLAYKDKAFNKHSSSKQKGTIDKVLHGSPKTKALNKILLEDKISSIDSLQKKIENMEKGEETKNKEFKKLTVSLGDRVIKINDYILSKPHAVGTNMSFFEAVYTKPNIDINIDELPDIQKVNFEWKSISKLLNTLGFTGEVLKAFFPKRSNKKPRVVKFLKSVSRRDLDKRGINISLLINQLEGAHLKNSPE